MEHIEVLPHTRETDKSYPNVLPEYDMQDQGWRSTDRTLRHPWRTKTGMRPINTFVWLLLIWIMQNTPPTRLSIQLDNTIIDRLGYANDVDLCGEHLSSVKETYVHFKHNAERTGMKINNAKT